MQRRQLLKKIFGLAATGVAACLPLAALAKPGRPASPNSVAGVNRRHHRRRRRRRRRRIHRSMRLTSLPYGCSITRVRGGTTFYYCSGIWYRPAYQGTTVIYIVEDIEPGASVDVEFLEY